MCSVTSAQQQPHSHSDVGIDRSRQAEKEDREGDRQRGGGLQYLAVVAAAAAAAAIYFSLQRQYR